MEKCRIKATISLQFNIFSFTNLGNLEKMAYICALLDKESTIIHESYTESFLSRIQSTQYG